MKTVKNLDKTSLVEKLNKLAPEIQSAYVIGTKNNMGRIETVWAGAIKLRTKYCQYLIVGLVNEKSIAEASEIRERIEGSEDLKGICTVLILSDQEYKGLRNGGNRCINILEERAVKIIAGEPEISEHLNKEGIEKVFPAPEIGFKRSKVFLYGAKIYRDLLQYEASLFLLHQALEQALLTYWREKTGYWLQTHNVDRLLKYCIWLDGSLNIYDRENPADVRLLRLIKASYINARYGESMNISQREINTLINGVERICSICEIVMEQ